MSHEALQASQPTIGDLEMKLLSELEIGRDERADEIAQILADRAFYLTNMPQSD